MPKKSAYAHRKSGRKPPRLGRRILTIIELLLGLAAIAYFANYFYRYTRDSDQFRVRNIQIEGLRVINEDEVLHQSGLLEDGNVLYLDIDAVSAKIKEIPYVRDCTIRQVFPDTVIIQITERVGILTLQLNSRSYLIDEHAVVLSEFDQQEAPLTPFITNVAQLEFIEIGDELTQPALHAALRIWHEFASLPMAQSLTVSEIAAISESELILFCDELPYEIRWGHEHIDQQAKRLNILWDAEGGHLNCTEYLDLRFEDNLVCQ